MRTKNLTPFLVGAVATSHRPPRPSMTLVVKGSFRLRPGEPVAPLDEMGAQGSLSGDVFERGDDERRGALLYPSDFADFKPRVDLLLRGRCFAPGGKAITECPARFSVGAWSKILRVIGPRVWIKSVLGDVPSDPAAFTSMPVDFTRAFGGSEHPDNPAGKGLGTEELHNVELPHEAVRSKRDRIAPASFSPLSPYWPERSAKVGKQYGGSYQQKRAPYFAEDFDWTYFQSAPADQQVDALRGDEELTFTNLHPTVPKVEARLPGLRIRAFVRDAQARIREISMRLDTVFVDMEAERLILIWRGVGEVEHDDLADIASVLVASEPLASEPLAAVHYGAELAAFDADPLGLERRRAEILERAGILPDDDAPAPDAGESAAWAALSEKTRALPAAHRRALRAAIDRAVRQPMPADAPDISQAIAQAAAAPPSTRPPIALPRKPGTPPYVPMGKEMRSIREAAERARKQVERPDVAAATADKKIDLSFFDRIDAIERNKRLKELDPYSFREGGPGAGEPSPGADLSGRDLRGADLRGRDLRGADLRGAILLGANLAGADLSRADLTHAILHGANVSDANFSEANLTLANLGSAAAARAIFQRATLDQTNAEKADLEKADLRGARGEYAVFSGANLAGVDAREVQLEKAFFDGATLEGADFSRATLSSCRLSGAKARGMRLDLARLDRSSFTEADLTGARLVAARGERVVFRQAILIKADISRAILPQAFFDEASAADLKIARAVLRRARFYRASLARADMSEADLFEADLRKADLTGASLAGANLYAARLRLARREGCDFHGANMKNVVVDGR